MKIRIEREIPIDPKYRPEVGGVYEVIGEKNDSRGKLFFIEVNGQKVGVYKRGECEVVPEAQE